jgi:hypothetical protein
MFSAEGGGRGDYVVRGRIVEWDATQVRHVDDVFAAWDAITADPIVLAGSGLLIDNGESRFDAPRRDVARLAGAVAQRLPKIKAVAIVASKPLHFGMARQFEVFAHGTAAEIHVFRDLASAREWLAARLPPAAAS